MTITHTVEEMRAAAISLATYDFRGSPAYEPALEEATGVVDTLIDLARAEGFAEGCEWTTSELATPTANGLPAVYGDSLPVKEQT